MSLRGSMLGYQLAGLAAIAQRDVLKLLRDRPRLAVNVAFPLFLVAGLGSLLQPTVGVVTGLNSVPWRSLACSRQPRSSQPPRA